jgi:hypothetical protein
MERVIKMGGLPVPRVEYVDDGDGTFFLAYVDEKGNRGEIQRGLSFYQSHSFHVSKGREVPLVRVEDLIRRCEVDAIAQANHRFHNG